MKATGILRKIDGLGRITLPMELRRTLDISEHDQIEVFMEVDRVVLRKSERRCVFCNANFRLVEFKEKLICQECVDKLKEL